MRVALLALLVSITTTWAASPVRALLDKKPVWFQSEEAKTVLQNVLSWQTPQGDWPKNTDTTVPASERPTGGTFDNSATVPELRLLAHAFQATGNGLYRRAFTRGLEHILEAQYANGGFPQHFPTGKGYARHITFNDGTMIQLLGFVRDVANGETFAFVESSRRCRAKTAFERGMQCILDCQITINGKRTVWCAQHDHQTLAPVGARSYELPSLSGSESAGILLFLMSEENPSVRLAEAIHAGAAWFENARLTGIRVVVENDDKRVVPSQDATALWARFYDLKTQKPFFCGRDGVKKGSLAEIEHERRNGYAWYGTRGARVAKAYANWLRKHPSP